MISETNPKTSKNGASRNNVNDMKVSEQYVFDLNSEVKLQLREEQLDIIKKWVQTSEVTVYKNVFTEEKNITVPVTHEELIIERKTLGEDSPNNAAVNTEIIRIPLSEEHINISKHRVLLEDVKIYKRNFETTEHIEMTLKKEKLSILE